MKTKSCRLTYRVLAVLFVLGVIMLTYSLWVRPKQLTWGASEEEQERVMPGDELHGEADFYATRAITINSSPENIWPWIIQMGYGRAGYYGYDLLENLGSPRGIRSAEQILPEFQDFQAGDPLPISILVTHTIAALEENRAVVWSSLEGDQPGAITWALYPVGPNQTRLVSRIGWRYHLKKPSTLGYAIFTEFTDHLAVRKILMGIKGRVEGEMEPFAKQNAEFGVYILSWLSFAASLALLLIGPLSWKKLGASLLAGGVWLITWYAPLPLGVGILLAVLTPAGLYWAVRSTHRQV